MSRTGKPESPSSGQPSSEQPASEQPAQPAPPAAPSTAGTQAIAVDARRVLLAGTAAFGLAFLVLLLWWNWLGEHQHRVWLWTALAGTVLGLLALPLVGKHSDEGRLG